MHSTQHPNIPRDLCALHTTPQFQENEISYVSSLLTGKVLHVKRLVIIRCFDYSILVSCSCYKCLSIIFFPFNVGLSRRGDSRHRGEADVYVCNQGRATRPPRVAARAVRLHLPGLGQAYEISNLAKDIQISRKISQISRKISQISRFQERFPDFQKDFPDFQISRKESLNTCRSTVQIEVSEEMKFSMISSHKDSDSISFSPISNPGLSLLVIISSEISSIIF